MYKKNYITTFLEPVCKHAGYILITNYYYFVILPLKFCDTFHDGHQLQKVAFQLEIHNTIHLDSIGQPKTKLYIGRKLSILNYCQKNHTLKQ